MIAMNQAVHTGNRISQCSCYLRLLTARYVLGRKNVLQRNMSFVQGARNLKIAAFFCSKLEAKLGCKLYVIQVRNSRNSNI